jgi:hypothetical protein
MMPSCAKVLPDELLAPLVRRGKRGGVSTQELSITCYVYVGIWYTA